MNDDQPPSDRESAGSTQQRRNLAELYRERVAAKQRASQQPPEVHEQSKEIAAPSHEAVTEPHAPYVSSQSALAGERLPTVAESAQHTNSIANDARVLKRHWIKAFHTLDQMEQAHSSGGKDREPDEVEKLREELDSRLKRVLSPLAIVKTHNRER